MGRFGNVMVTNGETGFSGQAAIGEVLRLCLVNTANTRTFKVVLPGARMKLVGGDSGRYERETFVDEVQLAPSERAIVDVLFDTPGDVPLEHRTPGEVYRLGAFTVAGTAAGDAARSFDVLRTDPELTEERQALAHHMERPPDKVLAFSSLMPLLYGGAAAQGLLGLSHASRGRLQRAGDMPQVRDEAPGIRSCAIAGARGGPRRTPRARPGRYRVGRPDAGDQPADERHERDLEAH